MRLALPPSLPPSGFTKRGGAADEWDGVDVYVVAAAVRDETGYITPFSTAEVASDGAVSASKGTEDEVEGGGHQQEAPKLQMRGRRGNVKARLA